MKKKINLQLMIIAALAIGITLLLMAVVCYRLLVGQVRKDLRMQAHVIRTLVYEDGIGEKLKYSADIEKEGLRITLIGVSGEVLYDSGGKEAGMDNHGSRPEVSQAWEQGEGWDIRESVTRGQSAFYYALQTKEGNVLRVSQEADNILRVLTAALPVVGLAALIIFIFCILIAHKFTDSLMKPVREAAERLEKQEEVTTYEELQPLVDTICKQKEGLLASVKIRQDFTANVSHELKTPLTSISGYAELIKNGMVARAEDITRFTAEIHKNANRLLTLINDIIRLSELDGGEMEEEKEKINLYQIAETCVNMLQINAEKHHVKISLQGEEAYVYSTRQMLEELIFNLCDNAIRYNREDGRVEVSVWNRSGKVVLTVKDNGIGIPEEHQDRIFERFYRVDKGRSKSTGGTGLGLAIVKHIVTKHDAGLEVASEAGRGTRIKITFSVSPPQGRQ